jgi:N-methylhydantoinase B/oxoprolinase/acetone carboxylase alpha subunit
LQRGRDRATPVLRHRGQAALGGTAGGVLDRTAVAVAITDRTDVAFAIAVAERAAVAVAVAVTITALGLRRIRVTWGVVGSGL